MAEEIGIGYNGGPTLKDEPKLRGHYEFKLLDPDGKLIREWELDNLVVYQGLNDLLNVYLNSGSQKTQWYVGLFQGNYAPSPTDTHIPTRRSFAPAASARFAPSPPTLARGSSPSSPPNTCRRRR